MSNLTFTCHYWHFWQVLPALMNEYRVPELNVQNGVLKALSFMFEYIGEMGKDYIYAVTPLIEDALMDRDLVHRQTACTVVKHMALGEFAFVIFCEFSDLFLRSFRDSYGSFHNIFSNLFLLKNITKIFRPSTTPFWSIFRCVRSRLWRCPLASSQFHLAQHLWNVTPRHQCCYGGSGGLGEGPGTRHHHDVLGPGHVPPRQKSQRNLLENVQLVVHRTSRWSDTVLSPSGRRCHEQLHQTRVWHICLE